jgi:hypothetical protein
MHSQGRNLPPRRRELYEGLRGRSNWEQSQSPMIGSVFTSPESLWATYNHGSTPKHRDSRQEDARSNFAQDNGRWWLEKDVRDEED